MIKSAANIACFSLNLLPFTMLLHFSLKKICAKFASATTKNAGQNACFCVAFSTKTHCNLHQNALQFAPKRKAFSTKAQTKDIKIGCKGLFINKLALKDEKRLGGFWRST